MISRDLLTIFLRRDRKEKRRKQTELDRFAMYTGTNCEKREKKNKKVFDKVRISVL